MPIGHTPDIKTRVFSDFISIKTRHPPKFARFDPNLPDILQTKRPIGLKTSDHTYFCPNQLLLGRSTRKLPVAKYDVSLNPKKRFQFIERLTQDYWKRWHVHYFPSLILHQKWHVEVRDLSVGDIVLVQDSKSFKGEWKLAEVCHATPGKDGRVRDVELRYKSQGDNVEYKGTKDVNIKRSVHRLVLIVPVEERPEKKRVRFAV